MRLSLARHVTPIIALALVVATACAPGDEWESSYGVLEGPLSAYCTAAVNGKGDKEVEGDYLAHVVACENGGAPSEALRAQAVAARSYLYYKLSTAGSIGDGQGDQVYTCNNQPSPQHYEAVAATKGQVLRYQGAQVAAFYVAGAKPSSGDCVAKPGDPDGYSSEKWVTYNWGKSGAGITQSPLGWVNSGNKANRGCKSQNGARCLAEHGWAYQDILKFYYGMDIELVTAEGSCTTTEPPPPPPPPPFEPEWRDVALGPGSVGGYTLDGTGALHPFGGSGTITDGPSWPDKDIARAIALRSDGVSGWVLDLYGALHPFGGAPGAGAAWYDTSADRARAVALRDDGSGWVLESNGALHPFGGAPDVVDAQTFSVDIARDVVASRDGGGWVLDGWGGVHPFGGAPPLPPGPAWSDKDMARSLLLSFDEQSGWVLAADGGLHPFGDALPIVQGPSWPDTVFARGAALRRDGVGGVVVDADGGVSPFTAEPGARALLLRGDGASGWIVFATGRLQSFGSAPDLGFLPPFATTAEAQDGALSPDGASGWVLGRTGALVPFGGAQSLLDGPLFGDINAARRLIMWDGESGWMLLGSGALVPFGGAPEAQPAPLWTADVARDAVVRSDGSGWVLDPTGGLHSFGGAAPAQIAVSPGTEARALALRPGTSFGYALLGDGTVLPFGGAPPVAAGPSWPGWDAAEDLVALPDGGGWVVDVYGKLHLFVTDEPGTGPVGPDEPPLEIDAGPWTPPDAGSTESDGAGGAAGPSGGDAAGGGDALAWGDAPTLSGQPGAPSFAARTDTGCTTAPGDLPARSPAPPVWLAILALALTAGRRARSSVSRVR